MCGPRTVLTWISIPAVVDSTSPRWGEMASDYDALATVTAPTTCLWGPETRLAWSTSR
jgi:hypothetical protein